MFTGSNNKISVIVGMQEYLVTKDIRNIFGIAKYIWFLAFDWVLYLVIILLIDYDIIPKIMQIIKVICVGEIQLNFQEDTDVRDERNRVNAARNNRGNISLDKCFLYYVNKELTFRIISMNTE